MFGFLLLTSQICNHTGLSVCGVDKKHSNYRFFLDECDLFEYNCDYRREYLLSTTVKCKQSSIDPVTTNLSNAETRENVKESSTMPETKTTVMNMESKLISTSQVLPSEETLTIPSAINDQQYTLTDAVVNTGPSTHFRECSCDTHKKNNKSKPTKPMDPIATSTNSTCTANSSRASSLYTQSMDLVTTTMSLEVSVLETPYNEIMSTGNSNNNITDNSLPSFNVTTASTITLSSKTEINTSYTSTIPYSRCTCFAHNASINTTPVYPMSTINTKKAVSMTSLPTALSEFTTSTEPSTNYNVSTQSSSISNTPPKKPETSLSISSSTFQSQCTCYPTTTSERLTTKLVVTTSDPTNSRITTSVFPTDSSTESLHYCTCGLLKENVTIPTNDSELTSTPINSITANKFEQENNNMTIPTNCDKYPKHCKRPHTWETTAKGETRDFFQILRARYGHRIKLLKDTTHYPRRAAMYVNSNADLFQFGRHSDIK